MSEEELGKVTGFSGFEVHYNDLLVDEKFAKSCIGKPVKDQDGKIIGEIVDAVLIDEHTISLTGKIYSK